MFYLHRKSKQAQRQLSECNRNIYANKSVRVCAGLTATWQNVRNDVQCVSADLRSSRKLLRNVCRAETREPHQSAKQQVFHRVEIPHVV